MGKGDQRSKKGKRRAGSRGKTRPNRRKIRAAARAGAKKAGGKKTEKKKAAPKSAAKKKTARKKA